MSERSTRLTLLALFVATACHRGSDDAATTKRSEPATSERAEALAEAIDEARLASPDERPTIMARTRRAWLDRSVSWEVGFMAPLCAQAGPCVVLPFDRVAHPTRLPQGWLPELELSASARDELRNACSTHAPICVVQIDARISRLQLSADDPTSVALTDVTLGSVRSPADTESWVRRPETSDRGDAEPHVVLSRTSATWSRAQR